MGLSLVTVNTTRPIDPMTKELAIMAGKFFLLSASALCKYKTPFMLLNTTMAFETGLTIISDDELPEIPAFILASTSILAGLAGTYFLPWIMRDDYELFKDKQKNGAFYEKNAQLNEELDKLAKKEKLLDKEKRVLDKTGIILEKEDEVQDLQEEIQDRLSCPLCTINKI